MRIFCLVFSSWLIYFPYPPAPHSAPYLLICTSSVCVSVRGEGGRKLIGLKFQFTAATPPDSGLFRINIDK